MIKLLNKTCIEALRFAQIVNVFSSDVNIVNQVMEKLANKSEVTAVNISGCKLSFSKGSSNSVVGKFICKNIRHSFVFDSSLDKESVDSILKRQFRHVYGEVHEKALAIFKLNVESGFLSSLNPFEKLVNYFTGSLHNHKYVTQDQLLNKLVNVTMYRNYSNNCVCNHHANIKFKDEVKVFSKTLPSKVIRTLKASYNFNQAMKDHFSFVIVSKYFIRY